MEMQELQRLKNKYDIIGNDAGLNRALGTAVAVAPTDLTVLITGESGVGKETIPQIIHQFSRRKNGKYLAVNCGAIPEGTINAELFGHEKGAFTGAIGERKGYFEEANGGTLFLDEIGELPRETQALLLRVLQNGEFMNNKDDIYLLFRKFTSDFSERYNLCKVSLSHDAISLLTAYRWPGNIRQLKNVAETVTALESRPVTPGSERIELGPAALMRYLPDEKDSMLPATTGPQPAGSMPDSDKQMIVKAILDLKQEVDRLKEMVQAGGGAQPAMPAGLPHYVEMAPDEPEEQLLEPETAPEGISIRKMGDELIERALAKHGGKVKAAAAELGVSERTIYRKLAEWKNNGKKA